MPTPEEVTEIALAHLRDIGCRCQPDISVRPMFGVVWDIDVQHDSWCPMMLALHADEN